MTGKRPDGRAGAWTDDHLFSNDGQVWDEWISLFASRDEMAEQYALELSRATSYTDVFWANINAAIVRRWSRSALSYIKREAWRIHPNRVRNDEISAARSVRAKPADQSSRPGGGGGGRDRHRDR